MPGKKGELTSKQLVTIIILIVSFAVILLFFLALNLKSEITKETCRNSVILKGTTPLGKDTVKLQCATQDVCITSGKNCQAEKSGAKVLQAKNKEELTSHLADLMYDCWWQMGGGKVSYAPRGWKGQYCVMCDVITFDKSIREKEGLNKVSLRELFVKLQEKKVPGSDVTYLYSLYGFTSVGAALDTYGAQEKGGEIDNVLKSEFDFRGQDKYALVTAVEEGASLAATAGGGIGGAISAAILGAKFAGATCTFVSPVVGTVLCAIAGGAVGGGAAFLISSAASDAIFLPPYYVPFKGETIRELKCEEFSSLAA